MPLTPAVSSKAFPITRFRQDKFRSIQDQIAVEEPLEIRLRLQEKDVSRIEPLAVTMRTPGMDKFLALGFLFSEGVISRPSDVIEVSHTSQEDNQENCNRIEVTLGKDLDTRSLSRHVFTSSSCGVCGKMTIDQVMQRLPNKPLSRTCPLATEMLYELPEKLMRAQETFNQTGGLHAAALFSEAGKLVQLCEDVGRHNALDKLIGSQFWKRQLPLDQGLLLLSGRISFELVQKAAMAGVPAIAAIGAPSSLAIQCAQETGIVLLGFLKSNGFNLYTGKLA